ncbi:MAG: efflux RND transporter periplasmic adaptor subunit, partial [Gammaproteobacteria bacterium]|nr:efflux RND transporter periplasmic adaptor subunit [Gammaproteobacteria bacterium]
MNRKLILVVAAAAGLAVLAGAAVYFNVSHTPPADERKVLYWTDPMVPGYRSDKPGKSPFMDMELVPVYEEKDAPEGAPAVSVGSQVVQKLGVRTTVVNRAAAERTLTATGYLFRDNAGLIAIADVFERDTSWIRPGLGAQVRVAELADARFAAGVDRIETDRDIGGRSVKLRVRLQQHDPRLQANMAADVIVSAPTAKRLLLVPREALIRTARRSV